jgi:hypothetical protein
MSGWKMFDLIPYNFLTLKINTAANRYCLTSTLVPKNRHQYFYFKL